MLELRELQRGDLEEVNKWRADREMIDCLGAPYRYINLEVDDAWFDGYMASRSTTVRCVVVDSAYPDEILALATLASIDWVCRSCVFHLMVGISFQGRGVGGFALASMLKHAFLDLGLRRVELEVLDTNKRARMLYEKAGFLLEGTRRQSAFKNGSFVDLHVMGLLRDDWDPNWHDTNSILRQP